MTMNSGIDLLVVFCAIGALLQVADYATTRLALERGVGTEANSIVRRLMLLFGTRTGLIVSKLVALCTFALLYALNADWRLVAVLDLVYLIIVVNNHRIART